MECNFYQYYVNLLTFPDDDADDVKLSNQKTSEYIKTDNLN